MQTRSRPTQTERLVGAPIFQNLDRSRVEQLVTQAKTAHHPRATRVLSRSEKLDGLFVVLDGQLKIYMLSCDGAERVLKVAQAGDSFGEAFMFMQIPSLVYVDTLTECDLAFLPSEVIASALRADPDFVFGMLRNMSAIMTMLLSDLETACMQNALQRTVNYLLRESEKTPAPHIGLTLPAPKAVVASTLNLSAETFSRELHQLQNHGYIEIERRVIRLRNRQGLRELADGKTIGAHPG